MSVTPGSTWIRVLLLCGILSPVLYALADLLAGLSLSGYSFRDQTISELGAIGAPSAALFSALLIPTYMLLTAFGIGVWRSAAGRRGIRVAGGLLVALGIMALTVGQFAPMQQRGTEQGLTGALHLIEGGVAMLMIFVAMGFAVSAMGSRFRLYTIATVLVMLAFGAWSGSQAPRIAEGLATPWVGVIERIFWYSYQAWFAVFALALLRERPQARDPR